MTQDQILIKRRWQYPELSHDTNPTKYGMRWRIARAIAPIGYKPAELIRLVATLRRLEREIRERHLRRSSDTLKRALLTKALKTLAASATQAGSLLAQPEISDLLRRTTEPQRFDPTIDELAMATLIESIGVRAKQASELIPQGRGKVNYASSITLSVNQVVALCISMLWGVSRGRHLQANDWQSEVHLRLTTMAVSVPGKRNPAATDAAQSLLEIATAIQPSAEDARNREKAYQSVRRPEALGRAYIDARLAIGILVQDCMRVTIIH